MPDSYHASLKVSGQNQILTIPSEFALSDTEVVLRKEGDRLIIEPIPQKSLLSVLVKLQDIPEPFPDTDQALLPLDDITL